MTERHGPYRDPTPTEKLLVLSAEVPPGGQYIQVDGDYTITVARSGGGPKQPGWYLLSASMTEEVAAFWTGTEWQPNVGMLKPEAFARASIDRLVPLRDVIRFLAVQPQVEMSLEALAVMLKRDFG